MIGVYEKCPVFEDSSYTLRMVTLEDCLDLLKVYSDLKSVPLFNCDNCGGDDFYYITENRMMEAIKYWLWEYSRQGFVRWSIVDNRKKEVIGTIELFHRDANDYYTNCGLLRLDLRSDLEDLEKGSDTLDSLPPKILNAKAFRIFTYYLFTIHSSLKSHSGFLGSKM